MVGVVLRSRDVVRAGNLRDDDNDDVTTAPPAAAAAAAAAADDDDDVVGTRPDSREDCRGAGTIIAGRAAVLLFERVCVDAFFACPEAMPELIGRVFATMGCLVADVEGG